jgi:uncharacterized membrane protein YqaE (UPF0057 family)
MEKTFWKSKKFWASVIAVLVPMLNHHLDWGMDVDSVVTMMTPMLAYILGQGMADMGKYKK